MADKRGSKSVSTVLFVLLILLVIGWWFTSSSLFDISVYYQMFLGFGIGAIVLIQSGMLTYFKESKYKTINADDFITYSLALVGGLVITTSLLAIPQLSIVFPKGLATFLFKLNVGIGLVALVIVLISIFRLRKKGG